MLFIGRAARKFVSTNQKQYPDLLATRHQNGISTVVPQTSLRGENSGAVAKCLLFSQAVSLGED